MHFGAKESLDGRPAAPVEAVGTESESGADVNGRSSKQLGGGSPGGCVARSHTAQRVFVSVCLLYIVFMILI